MPQWVHRKVSAEASSTKSGAEQLLQRRLRVTIGAGYVGRLLRDSSVVAGWNMASQPDEAFVHLPLYELPNAIDTVITLELKA